MIELTGTVYKHIASSSFHQSSFPLECRRTGQRHAAYPRVLGDPCQPAERLCQEASLLCRPLLDSLASYVSFLLQQ